MWLVHPLLSPPFSPTLPKVPLRPTALVLSFRPSSLFALAHPFPHSPTHHIPFAPNPFSHQFRDLTPTLAHTTLASPFHRQKNPDPEAKGYRKSEGYAQFIREGAMKIFDEKLVFWQACARTAIKYDKDFESLKAEAVKQCKNKKGANILKSCGEYSASTAKEAKKLFKEKNYVPPQGDEKLRPKEGSTKENNTGTDGAWKGAWKGIQGIGDYQQCEQQMESTLKKTDWVEKHLDPKDMAVALWDDYVAEATRAFMVCPTFPKMHWKNQENPDMAPPAVCVEWEDSHNSLSGKGSNNLLDKVKQGLKAHTTTKLKDVGGMFRLKVYNNEPVAPMLKAMSRMLQGKRLDNSRHKMARTKIDDYTVRASDSIDHMKKELLNVPKFKEGLRAFPQKDQDLIVENSIPYVYEVLANSYTSVLIDEERKRDWAALEEKEDKQENAEGNYEPKNHMNSKYALSPAQTECNRMYDVLRYMNNLPGKSKLNLKTDEMMDRVMLEEKNFKKVMSRMVQIGQEGATSLRTQVNATHNATAAQLEQQRRVDQVFLFCRMIASEIDSDFDGETVNKTQTGLSPDASIGARCGRPTLEEGKDGTPGQGKIKNGLCLPSILTYLLPSRFTRIFTVPHRAFYPAQNQAIPIYVSAEEARKCQSSPQGRDNDKKMHDKCVAMKACEAKHYSVGMGNMVTVCTMKKGVRLDTAGFVTKEEAIMCKKKTTSLDKCDTPKCSAQQKKYDALSTKKDFTETHETMGKSCRACGDMKHCTAVYNRGGMINSCTCTPSKPVAPEFPASIDEVKMMVKPRDVQIPFVKMLSELSKYGCPVGQAPGACDTNSRNFYPLNAATAKKLKEDADSKKTRRFVGGNLLGNLKATMDAAKKKDAAGDKMRFKSRTSAAGKQQAGAAAASKVARRKALQKALFNTLRATNRFKAIQAIEEQVNLPYPAFLATDQSFSAKFNSLAKAMQELFDDDGEAKKKKQEDTSAKKKLYGDNYGGQVLDISGKSKLAVSIGSKVKIAGSFSVQTGVVWSFKMQAFDYGAVDKLGAPNYLYRLSLPGDPLATIKAKLLVTAMLKTTGAMFMLVGGLDRVAPKKCQPGFSKLLSTPDKPWKMKIQIFIMGPASFMKELVGAFVFLNQQQWFMDLLRVASVNKAEEGGSQKEKPGDKRKIPADADVCDKFDGMDSKEERCKACAKTAHCSAKWAKNRWTPNWCACTIKPGAMEEVTLLSEEQATQCQRLTTWRDPRPENKKDGYGLSCLACNKLPHCKAEYHEPTVGFNSCTCAPRGPAVSVGGKKGDLETARETKKCNAFNKFYYGTDPCTTEACKKEEAMGESCEKCAAADCSAEYHRSSLGNSCACKPFGGAPTPGKILENVLKTAAAFLKQEGAGIAARLAMTANADLLMKVSPLKVFAGQTLAFFFLDVGCEASQRLMLILGDRWTFGLELEGPLEGMGELEMEYYHQQTAVATLALDFAQKKHQNVSIGDRVKKAFQQLGLKEKGNPKGSDPKTGGTNVTVAADSFSGKMKSWMKQGYSNFKFHVDEAKAEIMNGLTCNSLSTMEKLGTIFAQSTSARNSKTEPNEAALDEDGSTDQRLEVDHGDFSQKMV